MSESILSTKPTPKYEQKNIFISYGVQYVQESTKLVPTFVFMISKATSVQHCLYVLVFTFTL